MSSADGFFLIPPFPDPSDGAHRDLFHRLRNIETALNASAIVAITDRHGKILYVNDKFCELSQYPRSMLIGQDHRVVNSRYHSKEFFQEMWKTISEGKIWTGEIRNRARDGSYYWLAATITPFLGTDGRPENYVAIRFDITERKRTEKTLAETLSQLNAVLAAARSAVIATDLNGLIRVFNAGAEKMVGYRAADVVGRQTPLFLYAPEDVTARQGELEGSGSPPILGVSVLVARASAGEIDEKEWTFVHQDGSRIPVRVSITPIVGEDGTATGYLHMASDITEERHVRQSLAASRDAALQAARAKTDFLANMSHEIRTPMNGVIGMIDLLRDTPLTPRQKEFVETIQRSGETLLTIVNDILDFSKIEAGKMALESIPFDPRDVVEDVVQILAPNARRKGLEIASLIHPGLPDKVKGDPTRVRQVLLNLVGNAIKFTEKGSISVRCKGIEWDQRTALIQLSVSDTGPGMSRESVEKLFSPFTQGDSSTSRRFGGTGLGLAITHHLVSLMGGSIEVDSVPLKGSQFTVTLCWPISEDPSSPPEWPTFPQSRFLVVSRDPLVQESLAFSLSDMGGTIESAVDPESTRNVLAKSARERSPFTAILIDLSQNLSEGLDLARNIQAIPAHLGLPVLGVTSAQSLEADDAVSQAGVSALLFKPIRRSKVAEALNRVLKTNSTPAPADGAPVPPPTPPLGRILAAEDNEVNQKVLTAILTKLGYSVDIVPDGEAAVEAAKKGGYLAILMDCQMPRLDGYHAAHLIRQITNAVPVPIVAVTSNALSGDREKAIQSGMDDYVAKPLTIENLKTVLKRVLGSKSPPSLPEPTAGGETRLDLSILESLRTLQVAGGPDVVRLVVNVYLNEASTRLGNIHRALAGGNSTELADAVHALGGSSRSVGALRVGDLCKQLEIDARQGVLEAAPELVLKIQEECRLAQQDLRALIGEPPPASTENRV